jgi:dTDP-4-dehydrorhamnose 3,5-epimerase-like enzyme
MLTSPTILPGGLATDDRGHVSFNQNFDFNGVKRFYTVENHQQGYIRAWHYHKKEAKFVLCVKGSVRIGAVKVENPDAPLGTETPDVFHLSDKKADILFIPAGYANGFMSLSPDTKLIFFSSATLQESSGDDWRIKWDEWNIWEKNYR